MTDEQQDEPKPSPTSRYTETELLLIGGPELVRAAAEFERIRGKVNELLRQRHAGPDDRTSA